VRTLREWFRSVTDVRRGEYLPAGLMFVYGFLALTSHYIAKSVRNATFVQRVGADDLDVMYLLTAVVVTAAMVVYSRWVDRVRQTTLLQATFALTIGALLAFWQLLQGGSGVLVSGAFYLFVKLYGLLLVSQFWLVGNVLFTTRQAKRLFGPIGLGLILGGIAGGVIVERAAATVGTEDLLLVAAGVTGLCAAVVRVLGSRLEEGGSASGRLLEDISADALGLLRRSDHLRTIAWILGLTIVASTLVDWQLNVAVERFVPTEDAKSVFWGEFFVYQNLASVAVQLLATGFVLRKFGVGVAMLALPVGILVASAGVLAAPVLLTTALAKGTEGALRYSLDQSTRELLYLPVPTDVKLRAKPLIDLAVYRGGTGVAGLLLLLLTDGLGFGLRGVAAVCIGVVVAWMAATVRMRSEFRSSIRRLVGVRDVNLEELIVRRLDAGLLEELRRALREGDEEEVLYALALLEHALPADFGPDLRRLLGHESHAVRAKALSLLYDLGAVEHVEDVEPLLRDPSMDVRAEAIHFVCDYSPVPAADRMEGFLSEEDEEVRVAAIACLIRHGEGEQVRKGMDAARDLAGADAAAVRRDAARALKEVDPSTEQVTDLLCALVHDPDPAVRHEAMRSAGSSRNVDVVPELLEALGRPADRKAAREALKRYGSVIHDQLLEHLERREVRRAVRIQIPALLFTGARQGDVDRMLDLLGSVRSSTIRYHLVKTLDKLRRDRSDLDFDRYDLRELVRREVVEGYRTELIRHVLDRETARRGIRRGGGGPTLLERTLEQRRLEAGERALRILGLQYPQGDLYSATTALRSRDPLARQRGFELLENVLPLRYREWFDPLLEPDEPTSRRAAAARERFGLQVEDAGEARRLLEDESDFWLAVVSRIDRGAPPLGEEADPALLAERLRSDTLLGTRPGTSLEELDIMDIIERADFLGRTEIFANLRTEDLAALAALTDEERFREGDVLFREGATGCSLYLVVEGRVLARRGGRTVLEAGAGRTVGDLALLDGMPTHYEAVAAEDSRVLRLGREDFYDVLEERFRVARQVMAYLAGVVRDVDPERITTPTP